MGETIMMKTLKEFYANKKVLITGHTGFKGSWLVSWLNSMGAQVTGFALPPLQKDDHFNLLQLDKRISHVIGDIRDYDAIKKVFASFQPDIVFHLAAQALVRRSYNEPKLTFDTNIGGAVNVLEAIRMTPSVRSAVYITSDKCYSNREWVWGYRENDILGGEDPYSASKAAAEVVFHAYTASYFSARRDMGIASARAGNVIGGGDWSADRVVPDTIRSLRDNKQVILRNPDSTRPWQHVLEPLSGYLLLAYKLFANPKEYSNSYNFGPRVESIKTVKELAGKIVRTWGTGEIIIEPQPNAPHECGLLHLNCDKAHQELGWNPRWGFEKGVEKTVEWYRQVVSGIPAETVTASHIQQYMEHA
ncbi:MAG: CDP-glucose 4,6-dehydratase [Elusimicrobia bacterium]|nr:CDP-glucose 4,6-dehydratase [Elusimicrobiota bacterium]